MGNEERGCDERGVTPVVGIILLVAIAIVLAAVVGQYVFGLDLIQSPETGPQVSFSSDYAEPEERLNLTHESGDALVVNETTVVVSSGNGSANWTNRGALGEEITSSESIELSDVQAGETVRIIWESPETGDSYVVLTWEGPEAEA